MHEFPSDFYGSNLKIAILGYLRPMTTFKSLDELIDAMNNDKSNAESLLDNPENQKFQKDKFFQQNLKSKV